MRLQDQAGRQRQRDGFKGRAQACKAKADKAIIHCISNDRPFGRQDQRLWASAPSHEKSGEAGAGRTPTVSRRDIQKGADEAEF